MMRTKTIGFVSTMEGVSWGGSEELWSQAALRCKQRGAVVGVNVVRWPEIAAPLQRLMEAGCHVTRRPNSQAFSQKLQRWVGKESVYRWLDKLKPDSIIISQGSNADGLVWMEECERRGIPFAVIAQAASDAFWPPWEHASRLAAAYDAARLSCFVSRGNLDLTSRQLAHQFKNAHIVRNPFSVSYDAAPSWPEEGAAYRLACIGRLSPSAKGQDLLFEVLSQKRWRQRPIQVSLVGDGPNRETLLALKNMLDLNSVNFVGSTADIESVWASHHALVLPSRYEGLPLVIVEAMLCGRICIVTDVAGNAEILEDGRSGFVAAAPTMRCLDDAMEKAWDLRTSWREFGVAAAERVRDLVPRDPIGAFIDLLSSVMKIG